MAMKSDTIRCHWGGSTLNYEGSLASLYYSTYNTGTFKCCNYSVYTPPTRNYIFDPDFTQPQNLSSRTPMFRDIRHLELSAELHPAYRLLLNEIVIQPRS